MRPCLNPKTNPSGSLESNIPIRNTVLSSCATTEKPGRKSGEERPLIWFRMKDITKTTPLPRLLPLQMANVSTAGLAQLVFTVSIWTGTDFGAKILEERKSVPVSEKGVHPSFMTGK